MSQTRALMTLRALRRLRALKTLTAETETVITAENGPSRPGNRSHGLGRRGEGNRGMHEIRGKGAGWPTEDRGPKTEGGKRRGAGSDLTEANEEKEDGGWNDG